MQHETRGQSSSRGLPRGGGRGRGRGARSQTTPTTTSAPDQRHGQSHQGVSSQPTRGPRGRGRGASPNVVDSAQPDLPIDVAPNQIKAWSPDEIAARREKLQALYAQRKQIAVKNGLMSGDTQTSIDDAITTRGICTQMCDPKERIERMFNGSVKAEEMLPSPETGHLVPIDGRMVKEFRRSAAGTERQIPEELRTSKTLRKTLTYLFSNVLSQSDHLGKHHKFVWDRARGVRNDFTIQSFTKPEDVKYEVDCYERIVRFHILCLHQMSNPDELRPDEEYSRQQELEQLQKTFASLLDKYDTFGQTIRFRNEAEFRAYHILFAARTDLYDLDVQMQRWPAPILNDGRVQTALKLNAAATSTDYPIGSAKLGQIPAAVAQGNSGLFWTLLRSQQVGYLMACVAEVSFQLLRFTALDSLWRSAKSAPERGQITMRNWTKKALTEYLGFDAEEQTETFCDQFDLSFVMNTSNGQDYLDFQSYDGTSLPRLSFNPIDKKSQIFSRIVEEKLRGRTFTAIINGMSIVQATRAGMIMEEGSNLVYASSKTNSMFVGDNDDEDDTEVRQSLPTFTPQLKSSLLNPHVPAFTPSTNLNPSGVQPNWMTSFGQSRSPDSTSPGGPPKSLFKSIDVQVEQPSIPEVPALSPFTNPSATTQSPFERPTSGTSLTASTTAPNFSFFQSGGAPASPNAEISTTVASDTGRFAEKKPPKQINDLSFEGHGQPAASEVFTPTFKWATKPTGTSSEEKVQAQAFSFLKPSPDPASTTSSPFPATSPSTGFAYSPPSPPAGSGKPFNFGLPSIPTTNIETAPQTQAPFSFQASQFGEVTNFPAQTAAASTEISPAQSSVPFKAASNVLSPVSKTVQLPAANVSLSASNTAHSGLSGPQPTAFSLPPTSTLVKPVNPIPQVELLTQPEPEPINHDKLLEHLCRIGLVQQDGIMDMFVPLQVSKLTHAVFVEFRQGLLEEKTSAIKQKVLARKYFSFWRSVVAHKVLHKRAEKRRRRLATSLNTEKRQQLETNADLAEIIEADKVKKRIQEEQRQRQEEVRRRKEEERSLQIQNSMRTSMAPPPQQAGQKRKTLANSVSRTNITDELMRPMHKRSRTLGSTTGDTATLRASSSPTPEFRDHQRTSTTLRRSLSHRSLRQSITQQRLDQTQNDYFRLKAMGIDPDTPLLPDTAGSLAAKEKRQAKHQMKVVERINRRPSSVFAPSRSSASTSPVLHPQSNPATPPSQSLSQRTMPSGSDNDEDPFLKSLREARETMVQDADWFKAQGAEIEKEAEQLEDFRRSRDSISALSSLDSFTQSTNGFARSTSGFDYVTPELKPGQTLSRTEERIRRTGARGLANKPIGGRPVGIPRSDYVPVPMSRRSASAPRQRENSHQDSNVGSNQSRKRSFDDVNGDAGQAVSTGSSRQQTRFHDNYHSAGQVAKKAKNQISMQGRQSLEQNPFDDPVGEYHVEEDDDEGVNEEQYDEEDQDFQPTNDVHNGVDFEAEYEKYYEENVDDAEDEEEIDDEGEDEEEEEEDDDEEPPHHNQHLYLQPTHDCSDADIGEYYESSEDEDDDDLDGQSASQHNSRAISAAATPDTGIGGSTVEEAIELSD